MTRAPPQHAPLYVIGGEREASGRLSFPTYPSRALCATAWFPRSVWKCPKDVCDTTCRGKTLHEVTCRSFCTWCAHRGLQNVAEQHGTCMRRRTAGGDKETRFCTPSALRPPASASILRRPHGPRLGVCASHDAFHAVAPLTLCWRFFGRCCGRLAAGLCRGRGRRRRRERRRSILWA